MNSGGVGRRPARARGEPIHKKGAGTLTTRFAGSVKAGRRGADPAKGIQASLKLNCRNAASGAM